MKKVSILMLCIVTSCVVKKTGKKSTTTFSQETLVSSALKVLNIDASRTDFVFSKITPNNLEETIIVIPEVVNEEDEVYELNTNIVIANNKTGKITHHYFESSKTNGWYSDAIFIESIEIDTTNYKLNRSKNAFGVIVKKRSMSQPNPYNEEIISLFTKEKGGIKKILDSYIIYEDSGIVNVNMNACYADFKIVANKLSVGDTKTNGYFDILVHKTITQRNFRDDENGECNPKEKIIATEETLLRFNKKEYKRENPEMPTEQ
ncbi:hypothetical protein [Aquimarina sp. 2201CG14-23]|uniref:hypothetical protein n=1 Tax=Aquimarina mycalae TaxID=3040073 RepID=UPI002477EE7C|nr:hypothetical protein [Aquimarina sp. 2201CG14-23]MDH7447578.1 hypothetical protein [Aquimarina sp. 2201CG14-23]